METANQNIDKKSSSLEYIAEAWVRICLADIEQRRLLVNQDKDKTYENKAR